ncbi:hypothetical protein [Pararhizobium mangrovi]|uniref:Uncharacterized protein n=1 Tax=Pararhizobium mangrovi TaxID=2590452 RepID=A0A506U1L3_9HYPH|nr:hypothetical protein [Pararhizobium mangrovi]TPW26855.1 hypothetical protein FJU11_13700 [Pararhizobium mangrovi]
MKVEVANRECAEFILVAPVEKLEAVRLAKHRILETMERKFPGFSFHIVRATSLMDEPPTEFEDEWLVVPMLGRLEEAGSPLCERPPAALLAKIRLECDAIDLERARYAA